MPAQPRTVLAIAQVATPGGAEVILLRTMSRLVQRGWKVVLATPGPGPLREQARAAGIEVDDMDVPVGTMRRSPLSGIRGALAVALLARRHDAGSVYFDGRVTQRLVPALGLVRVNGVVHIHDLLKPGDQSRAWTTAAWKRVSAVLVDSEAVGRALTALGIDADLIRNVRVAVELDPPPPATPPDWAAGGGEIVGYVGRIEPRKGTLDLMKAAPAILTARPNARIVVIGDDEFGVDPGYADNVRLAAGLPELEGRIVFTGAQPGAHSLMSSFDVFAFPSIEEPGGTAAAEALAAGVPVVAADTGGMAEVVLDGENGRLVPPGDPDALAAAIIGVLADPDRARMAARAREHAELFSADRSADVVEAALIEATGE